MIRIKPRAIKPATPIIKVEAKEEHAPADKLPANTFVLPFENNSYTVIIPPEIALLQELFVHFEENKVILLNQDTPGCDVMSYSGFMDSLSNFLHAKIAKLPRHR